MTESPPIPPSPPGGPEDAAGEPEDRAAAEGGVAEALRAAIERTMDATVGSAATTRERATELVDEVVRRGRVTRDELARRGQEAGAELARRGQDATGEVAKRLEQFERRLAELERTLGPEEARPEPEGGASPESKPEVEE
jgi:polyhydroxyalkanoate synthesis regulator phasin